MKRYIFLSIMIMLCSPLAFSESIPENPIGIWSGNWSGTTSKVYLGEDGNGLYLVEEFSDGSVGRLNVTIDKSGEHIKFISKSSPTGDFSTIIDGYLELWDMDGFWFRFEIIKEPDTRKLQ